LEPRRPRFQKAFKVGMTPVAAAAHDLILGASQFGPEIGAKRVEERDEGRPRPSAFCKVVQFVHESAR
jgi:hypothetical protein